MNFIFPFFVACLGAVESSLIQLVEGRTKGCDKALQEFANSAANFTLCAIMNARPITLCEFCATNYTNVQVAYDQILKLEDESGAPCRKILINVVRLEILENGYMYVQHLWKNGHCESCLEVVNGTITDKLRNETQQFLKFYHKVNACFSHHYKNGSYNDSVCKDCKTIYDDMNDFYEKLKNIQGEGNICVDIVDSVNTTRADWSELLSCDRKEIKLEIGLVVALVVVGLLPMVFYTSTKYLASHAGTRLSQQKRLVQTFTVNSSTRR
ncbi:hypothetical protein R5R35_008314 [Gryllus longicercus]|uniref:Osteopetrosis-associated transmembrane protein 1 n=1 Tax=Gryllus longicercus TaxID=2509291 RepID=A0AAN9VX32_9ORTH